MKHLCQFLIVSCLSLSLFACAAPSSPKADEAAFTSENVEIESQRNTQIKTTVVTPNNTEEAYPLVVFAHGFLGSRDESGAFTEVAEQLALAGIASIRLDFPGCNESEEDFMNYTIENMISDVDSVFSYAKENLKVDESKLGMLGYSMGGRIVSLYLDKTSVHTTVLWAPAAANGLSSLQSMGTEDEILKKINDSAESGVATITMWGQDIPVAHDFLKQSAEAMPMDKLAAYTGNLLFITGGQDNTVIKAITDPAIEVAVNTNITAVLDIPRATHSLGAGEFGNDPAVQKTVVDATANFFIQNLK